ncbi:WLM-domain-containing protein [Auricularia subglabra TFB-10046 SS5]|nr:WLM-domain-containing protein [Auricularia subglabra TFB-10046 SS5]
MLNLTITHRGQKYTLSAGPDSTLDELQARIAELTDVPMQYQKLLYGKGKKKDADAATMTLTEAGLSDGAKIMLLGSTAGEMDGMKAAESEKARREDIMARRAAKGPTKVWSRAPSTPIGVDAHQYRFHRIAPLPHLPNPAAAEALLKRLADDPAIRHVMQTHKFSVGLLTELAPHEAPHLLGLNENRGQTIKLRLRTDRYDGMRLYADVRRVLCHELTHNVWGDHDDNFKALNSKLNKEVAEFERTRAAGAHHLGGAGGQYYEPGLEADAHAAILGEGSYVLGGSAPSGGDDSREGRRAKALEAAMRRLKVQEEEIEHMCGSEGVEKGAPSS